MYLLKEQERSLWATNDHTREQCEAPEPSECPLPSDFRMTNAPATKYNTAAALVGWLSGKVRSIGDPISMGFGLVRRSGSGWHNGLYDKGQTRCSPRPFWFATIFLWRTWSSGKPDSPIRLAHLLRENAKKFRASISEVLMFPDDCWPVMRSLLFAAFPIFTHCGIAQLTPKPRTIHASYATALSRAPERRFAPNPAITLRMMGAGKVSAVANQHRTARSAYAETLLTAQTPVTPLTSNTSPAKTGPPPITAMRRFETHPGGMCEKVYGRNFMRRKGLL